MRAAPIAAALAGTLAAGAPVQTPPDASTLVLSAPVAVAEIDAGKLKGDLVRLAWSPDATAVYLRAAARDSRGGTTARHYVLDLATGVPKAVAGEPPWAAAYWSWKSAQAAPDAPSWRIEVEQQRKRVTATATPMGGSLARGDPSGAGTGVGMGLEETGRMVEQGQMVNVYTLRLNGEVVGEFVNAPAIPGLTFGWGPPRSRLIAFVDRDGRVAIMDAEGRKHPVPASRSALLPAWSVDGRRLAYLEGKGKKKFVLRIVEVGSPGS